jgi:tryptophan synthase alpha chain
MREKLFNSKSSALICYIIPGYPDHETSLKLAKILLENGADALELGVPFSDPIADGITIQKASYKALTNGINLKEVIKFARILRKEFSAPIYLMSYLNPLFKYGYERVAEEMRDSEINGAIIPDLPVDLFDDWYKICEKFDLETVLLCSPSTSLKRIKIIESKTTGFIYLVSIFGVTGVREYFPEYTFKFIAKVSKNTIKPIVVGFGISNPLQVKEIMKYDVDGIVVGSAILRYFEKGSGSDIFDKIKDFLKEIKKSIQRL